MAWSRPLVRDFFLDWGSVLGALDLPTVVLGSETQSRLLARTSLALGSETRSRLLTKTSLAFGSETRE